MKSIGILKGKFELNLHLKRRKLAIIEVREETSGMDKKAEFSMTRYLVSD